jgi:hypothetical protein
MHLIKEEANLKFCGVEFKDIASHNIRFRAYDPALKISLQIFEDKSFINEKTKLEDN